MGPQARQDVVVVSQIVVGLQKADVSFGHEQLHVVAAFVRHRDCLATASHTPAFLCKGMQTGQQMHAACLLLSCCMPSAICGKPL